MASGNASPWGFDLAGYYDYLGRAFASGHLNVPIDPAQYQMHDMALYHGRYYLYHGAAPAVLLFAPYRLATGHDLPEPYAQFAFCFGGFLFSTLVLLRILRLARVESGPGTLALLLLTLALCTGVPYLLTRVWVYEIAIACGFCCTTAGVFFLAGGVESRWRAAWWATSGLCFGLAIASRPARITSPSLDQLCPSEPRQSARLPALRSARSGNVPSHPSTRIRSSSPRPPG